MPETEAAPPAPDAEGARERILTTTGVLILGEHTDAGVFLDLEPAEAAAIVEAGRAVRVPIPAEGE